VVWKVIAGGLVYGIDIELHTLNWFCKVRM
jgi:hypothetical protein